MPTKTREPDRYEAKGVETWRALRIMTEADAAPTVAAALRQSADEALERAAYIADSYGCDYAAKNIRALASPAAAPAAEHHLGDGCLGQLSADHMEKVAPSLLPRVLAALEECGDGFGTSLIPRHAALAAELRRYIAGVEADPIAAEIDDALAQRVARQTIRIAELEETSESHRLGYVEALARAREHQRERDELRAGMLRLLRDGYGPGGGYYDLDQRVGAAVGLLEVGWGTAARSEGET